MLIERKKPSIILNIITSRLLIGGLIFASLGMASLLPSMQRDEGMWTYMAWAWVKKGIPPLAGSVDNKPAGIYFVYALSQLLFGVNNFLFPRFLAVLATIATGLVLYQTGSKLHNKQAGAFSMLFLGLTMCWNVLQPEYMVHTEPFMILFSSLAFYILLKTDHTASQQNYRWGIFLSGFSMGIAIAFKQIALFSAVGLFLFYLTFSGEKAFPAYKNVFLDFLIALAGIIVATIFMLTPLLFSKVTFTDYWEINWLLLFKCKITTASASARKANYVRMLGSRLELFLPLVILFIVFKNKMEKLHIPFYGLSLWFILDFIGAFSAGYCFGHHIKQMMPPLALISGIALSLLIETWNSDKSQTKIVALFVLIIALWLPYGTILMYAEASWPIKFFYTSREQEIGLWVKNHTSENDYVYLFSCANRIQTFSERVSPSKFINATFIDFPGAEQKLINDLKTKPPKIFVQEIGYHELPEEIKNMLEKSYQKLFSKHGFIVYGKGMNPSQITEP